MKTLGLFIEPPGTRITIKTQATDVMSYVVFVRKWIETGPIPVATWLPKELESAAGASFTFGDALGYDVILKAQIRPKKQSFIDVDLKFASPGKGGKKEKVDLPEDEGPVVEREWKVVIA